MWVYGWMGSTFIKLNVKLETAKINPISISVYSMYLYSFYIFFSVCLQASWAGGQSSFLRHLPHPDLTPAEPLCGGGVALSPSAPLHQPIHGLHPLAPQQPLHLCSVSHPGPQPCRWWIKWNIHRRAKHDTYIHSQHRCTLSKHMHICTQPQKSRHGRQSLSRPLKRIFEID